MRDSHQMRDRSEGRLERNPVIWATLAGVAVVAGVFGAGFVVGKRAARLEAPVVPALDPISQLDAERREHDNLTFYSQLTAKTPPAALPVPVLERPTVTPPAPAPAPVARPEAPAAPAPVVAKPDPVASAPAP